jgi:hypothetical protein
MSWLKPVITIFAVLTLATLAWASHSDEVAEETAAPPAAAPVEEESEFPDDAADFPDGTAEFPGGSALQDLPEPKYRRPVGGDVKGQLLQLLQRELQRKMREKRGNAPHPRDLRRSIEQQIRDLVMEFEQSAEFDAAPQFGRREVEPSGHHEGVHGQLEHMQAAVHHLHAADLHEMAEIVEQQADAIHRVAQAQHGHVHQESHADEHAVNEYHLPAPKGPAREQPGPQRHGVLHELMERIDLLQSEVGELRKQVEANRSE